MHKGAILSTGSRNLSRVRHLVISTHCVIFGNRKGTKASDGSGMRSEIQEVPAYWVCVVLAVYSAPLGTKQASAKVNAMSVYRSKRVFPRTAALSETLGKNVTVFVALQLHLLANHHIHRLTPNCNLNTGSLPSNLSA